MIDLIHFHSYTDYFVMVMFNDILATLRLLLPTLIQLVLCIIIKFLLFKKCIYISASYKKIFNP